MATANSGAGAGERKLPRCSPIEDHVISGSSRAVGRLLWNRCHRHHSLRKQIQELHAGYASILMYDLLKSII